jgi:glycerol uptake facilitator-like aquaporin
MGLVGWSNFWLYLVADLLGGLVAGLMFKVLNPEDK